MRIVCPPIEQPRFNETGSEVVAQIYDVRREVYKEVKARVESVRLAGYTDSNGIIHYHYTYDVTYKKVPNGKLWYGSFPETRIIRYA